MRRRLTLLSLATTSLVVIALVVPLGLLVRRQAADSARSDAEREAQSVASLVALALAVGPADQGLAGAIGELEEGTIVVVDGTVVGDPKSMQGALVEQAMADVTSRAGSVDGGWEIALPVVGRDSIAVVDVFISNDEMSRGVASAWILLALLAFVLVVAATLVADRLGKSLVVPIADLAETAHRLAEGDLDTRVEPSDPQEIRDVGEAFNYLADRLDDFLEEERESMADLSHRLRTPLTSLRLQAERITDPDQREAVVGEVDRMQVSVDRLIEMARSPAAAGPRSTGLDDIVARRLEFWRVLADEQGRELRSSLDASGAEVDLSSDQLEAMLDVLVENVFIHTSPGVGFEVGTGIDERGVPWLLITDGGPGFGTGGSQMSRGFSGGSSTGLGLDIVRKFADSVHGRVDARDRPEESGAVVRVSFG